MSTMPLISGVELVIDGQPLDRSMAANLLEVRTDHRFMLPAAFLIRISDPQLQHIDSSPLEVGATVEISLAAAGGDTLQQVVSGQITSVEPEFGRLGAVLAARGYDQSHSLNRSRIMQELVTGRSETPRRNAKLPNRSACSRASLPSGGGQIIRPGSAGSASSRSSLVCGGAADGV